VLVLNRLQFAYAGRRAVRDIDASIASGEMVAVLGPNGAGKTTLLKLAAGLLRATAGEALVDGRDVTTWPRRRLAQCVAYLPQETAPAFSFSVALMVELGRAPFQRGLGGLSPADRQAIEQALHDTATAELADRSFAELSGGERRRVLLAMALAQQPRLLLVDEPTAHLDLRFQLEVLRLLRALNQQRGVTVVAAMHDLNLASLFFNRLLLLRDGQLLADGTPRAMLTAERLAQAYDTQVMILPHPGTGRPQVLAGD